MSWKRVRGHEALVLAFDRAVRQGRLGHAYLFVGPSGVGKRLFAGELARALLCENPPAGRLDACDACSSCLLLDAGNHPDFFVAGRPEDRQELPIDTVRRLCQDLSLKPARGRRKVAILDDADDLNDESANCFLKTLEEPPPGSLLILIGTNLERQLPTIVSRCQVIRFAPLPEALVAEMLRAHGVQDPAQAARLARLAGGSPGKATALADPALWSFRRALLDGLARPPVDVASLGEKWREFVDEAGKESGAQRRRAALALGLLIESLHDALRVKLGGRARLDDAEDTRLLQQLGNAVDAERLLELVDRCLDATLQIERRGQLILVLEALLDAFAQKMPAG